MPSLDIEPPMVDQFLSELYTQFNQQIKREQQALQLEQLPKTEEGTTQLFERSILDMNTLKHNFQACQVLLEPFHSMVTTCQAIGVNVDHLIAPFLDTLKKSKDPVEQLRKLLSFLEKIVEQNRLYRDEMQKLNQEITTLKGVSGTDVQIQIEFLTAYQTTLDHNFNALKQNPSAEKMNKYIAQLANMNATLSSIIDRLELFKAFDIISRRTGESRAQFAPSTPQYIALEQLQKELNQLPHTRIDLLQQNKDPNTLFDEISDTLGNIEKRRQAILDIKMQKASQTAPNQQSIFETNRNYIEKEKELINKKIREIEMLYNSLMPIANQEIRASMQEIVQELQLQKAQLKIFQFDINSLRSAPSERVTNKRFELSGDENLIAFSKLLEQKKGSFEELQAALLYRSHIQEDIQQFTAFIKKSHNVSATEFSSLSSSIIAKIKEFARNNYMSPIRFNSKVGRFQFQDPVRALDISRPINQYGRLKESLMQELIRDDIAKGIESLRSQQQSLNTVKKQERITIEEGLKKAMASIRAFVLDPFFIQLYAGRTFTDKNVSYIDCIHGLLDGTIQLIQDKRRGGIPPLMNH